MNSYADFSGIAFAYDYLARIFFGDTIKRCQIWTLKSLQENATVLIPGGGTGWILEEIDKLNIPLEIVYVEPSKGMMRRSKERKINNLKIRYINEMNGSSSTEFDKILHFFYLDLFNEVNLEAEIISARNLLKPKGFLLFADFQLNRKTLPVWQKSLSFIMHQFFRRVTGMESNKLKDLHSAILKSGFNLVEEKFFYGNFISGKIYQKI
jgi:ubiquinone/menaquinone biosynthesis C-methylase UbiE